MDGLNPEQLQYLLQSAIQAPSADNRHPVHFQLGDRRIFVHHTRTKWDGRGYKRVLDLLSLGALVENLSIAASRYGFGMEMALLSDPNQPDLVLQLVLLPGTAQADPLWRTIPLRHTSRQIRFKGPPISGDERKQIDAAVQSHPACVLHWLDARQPRRSALALMLRAETERFHNRLLHRELFSAINFDVGWRRACEEGLPPGALGVEPPLRGLFALLRHWPVMRLASWIGAHHLLGWRSCYLPCRLAPHLGLLAVKKTDSTSVIAAGRAFQRLWLTATNQGRVLQPMPASALYALEGAEDEGIPIDLQHVLAAGWQAQLGEGIPLMLFRMGMASPSSINAGRPQPEAYLSRFSLHTAEG